MKKNQKGFTLIELLVVIAIIGLLSTLSVVALNSARGKSRDARRVSDIKQIQTALELYYNDQGGYPVAAAAITLGAAAQACLDNTGFHTVAACTGTTKYMATVPVAPTPVDGSCTAAQNNYDYTAATSATYSVTYCLGAATGGIPAAAHTACPSGIQCS